VLVLNLLEALDTLYIIDTEDMTYNLIHTGRYLLTCFQYKTKENHEFRSVTRQ
jgi:hypothetical protein